MGRGHGGWLGSWEEKSGVACMEIAFFDERVLRMGLYGRSWLGLRKELGWRAQFGGYMNLDFFDDNYLKGNAETLCL